MNARTASLLSITYLAGFVCAAAQAPLWLDVPFVRQPAEGCGAASIAMLMAYWKDQGGRPKQSFDDVSAIQAQLYSRDLHGISAQAMVDYFQQHGYRAFAFNGTWDDLQQQLEKGRPLIVALRPPGQKQLHYIVVDGIDSAHQLVIFNDPAERKLMRQEREEFERQWKFTHNWLLLAVPVSPSP